jgi:Lipopolysaccharide kinase (Kdo/WaaP) family
VSAGGATGAPPAGYARVVLRGVELVARTDALQAVRDALEIGSGSLYEYAARHPAVRARAGRNGFSAYLAPLPNGDHTVVRHNRHGGFFAPVTLDLFLPPTRAPGELWAALRLAREGVPTPEVLAYAIYPAGLLLRRSDVMTREIRDGRDLGGVLVDADETARHAALEAATLVIGTLSRIGARHHDLNVKNLLIAPSASLSGGTRGVVAYVLDVDRVEFLRPGDSRVTERNLSRFLRSARKWREIYGARVDESELVRMASAVRRLVASRPSDPARRVESRTDA